MAHQTPGDAAGYRRDDANPPYLYPDYVATRLRAPKKPLIILPETLSDTTGPAFGRGPIEESDNDLTRQHGGEPLGEDNRYGTRPRRRRTPRTEQPRRDLAGQRRRTLHTPSGPAPCSARPELLGAGRCLTDGEGRYRFVTVKPVPIPGRITTTPGARRTYTSLFGPAFRSRLITQMYFPATRSSSRIPSSVSAGQRARQRDLGLRPRNDAA